MPHRLNRPCTVLLPHRKGVAALTVVMILFFVMALVAAYTNRNLIFEQRISANNYRSVRALAEADAGIDWTLAMLNGGRIGLNCLASANAADSDFRNRYLRASASIDGGYDIVNAPSGAQLLPACIGRDGQLNCICPTPATPAPALDPAGDGIGSVHRIAFMLPGNAVRPGALEFISLGCATPGSGDTACAAANGGRPAVDAWISTLTSAGLVRALPTPPVATLTVGGSVSGAGDLQVQNADAATGVTVHAGSAITVTTHLFQGPAGSGSDGARVDASLATLAAAPNEAWFKSIFGMDSATYQRQPAVVRVDCNAGCTAADLANVLAGHPHNPIWIAGDLDLDAAATLGSATDPLMLIVRGTLTVSGAAQITGFVHADAIHWNPGADTAWLQGAMVASGDFSATALATLRYDAAVLDIIRLRYGSFVRVPGSWNLTTRTS